MKIGIDNVDIGRVTQKLWERFFTANEIAYINEVKEKQARAAGIFAVKEAVLKAIGTGLRTGMTLKDIEVGHDKNGRPFVKLFGKVKEEFEKLKFAGIDVSITHSKTIATAICLLF